MMTRCHFRLNAFLLSLFMSFPCYSGTVEVAQWIPWKILTDRLEGKVYQSNDLKDEVKIQVGEFNPTLSDVRIETRGITNGIEFKQDGLAVGLVLEGKFSASKIIVDQFITRTFNGNVIQIHVKANCTGPVINIRNLFADGIFQYKRRDLRWNPEIQGVHLSLGPNDWDLSEITCQGIGGIGEELTLQIQEALKNPNMFSSLLKEVILRESEIGMKKIWEEIVTSASQDLIIKEMLRPDQRGLRIMGDLILSSARVEKLGAIDTETLSDSVPQLIISHKGFEALLEDQYKNLSSRRYNLQDIAGFKELMSSRITQYFVWPDLRRFPSSNPFYLSMFPEESRVILKQNGLNSWNTQINSNGRISTLIGGSEIEYLYIGVSFETDFFVDVKDGEMTLQSSEADLDLAWSFGFLYQLLYKPNQRISTKILRNAVRDSLINQTIIRKLPSLNIDNKTWVLQNFNQDKNFIKMDWL